MSGRYENISHQIGKRALELGWIGGVTEWTTSKTVTHHAHRHPHMEVLFCLKGTMTYEIDGHGCATVREGCGIVIPADTDHIIADGKDAPCGRIGLLIDRSPPSISRYGVFSRADFEKFYSVLAGKSATPFRLDMKLMMQIRELVRLVRSKRPSSLDLALVRALCCSILVCVANTLANPIATPQPQIMDEAVKFLESRFAEKLTSGALAHHMGYGRTQLFRLFKQHTGLSPNEYLVRFRIKKAKEMLERTQKPIAAVAKSAGFSSTSYFNRVFAKYEGCRPEVTK
jgi:AraC-like DNA-binding protein